METFDSGDYQDKFSDYYKLIKVIDRGAFGTVVQAIDKYTNKQIAVKILVKQTLKPGHIAHLRQEAQIMASLRHKNVITFKHMKETQRRVFLAMELLPGSNLHTYLKTKDISEGKARAIIKEILQGLDYLHSKGIIHRDLKPENILIVDSPFLTVKITDFGLSTVVGQEMMETGKCGTLIFMAPEQKLDQYYSKAIDIWSCGIILYMLLANGRHPLADHNENSASYIKKLQNPVFKDTLPMRVKSLFMKMVSYKPLERYTTSQCLAHPWITNQATKVPLTMVEEFKQYGDILKLKAIAISLVFCNIVRPFIPKQPKPPVKRRATPLQKRSFIRVSSSAMSKAPYKPRGSSRGIYTRTLNYLNLYK